jgi:glutathione synthase/RimK-type ligase-like ATP-grasp enzyme
MKYSFVTYSQLPELDPDDQLMVAEMRRRGHECQAVVWNDEDVDWNNAGICVIRNTWDYHLQPDEFLRWAEAVARSTRLFNSVELIKWNIDKKYLVELKSRGVNIVPTVVFRRDPPSSETLSIRIIMREQGWHTAVIKPTIGLATSGVKKFATTSDGISEAEEHLSRLLEKTDVLLQPYLSSVETYGERSLIFIGGEFSHAIRKTAFQIMAIAGAAGERFVEASQAEIAFGNKVLRALGQTTLYARVDMVPDDEGDYCLLELELIEPSLFLSAYAPSAVSFANALERATS